jgi:hypothetical protein
MKIIQKIKWYECIGWLVEVILIALAAFFIWFSFQAGELRAALIGLVLFGISILAWGWVLIFFGKAKPGPEGEKA